MWVVLAASSAECLELVQIWNLQSNLWTCVVTVRILLLALCGRVLKKKEAQLLSLSMDHWFREQVLALWLWAGINVIAALCSHSAILLMLSIQHPQIQAAPKAQWDTKEVFVLLDYLAANKSQGDGTGNFKDTTFIGAATAIPPLSSTGPPKTAKHCKTKWASVSLSVFFSSSEAASELFTAQSNIQDHRGLYLCFGSPLGQCEWCKHSGCCCCHCLQCIYCPEGMISILFYKILPMW